MQCGRRRGDDIAARLGRAAVEPGDDAAGADEVVSTEAVAAYARRLRGGSVLMIDGARHEILQEADMFREQFFAAFDAFVPGFEEVLA